MKLSSRSVALVLFFFSATTLHAGEGGMEGGGGIGVQCGNKLRTLDVYEAEEIYNVPTAKKFSTVTENLDIYGYPLAEYYANRIEEIQDGTVKSEFNDDIQYIQTLFSDISNGKTLKLSKDATLPKIPSTCTFKQIAFYDDNKEKIFRDPKLWAMLDSHGKASLILHEYYYAAARGVNAKTSDDTRRLIGLAMFGKLPEPLHKRLWGKADDQILTCTGGDQEEGPSGHSTFHAYNDMKNGVAGVTLLFEVINDTFVSFLHEAFVAGLKIDDFTNMNPRSGKSLIYNSLDNSTLNVEFKTSTQYPKLTDFRIWSEAKRTPPFTTGYCWVGPLSF
jgi:hypothetical protein